MKVHLDGSLNVFPFDANFFDSKADKFLHLDLERPKAQIWGAGYMSSFAIGCVALTIGPEADGVYDGKVYLKAAGGRKLRKIKFQVAVGDKEIDRIWLNLHMEEDQIEAQVYVGNSDDAVGNGIEVVKVFLGQNNKIDYTKSYIRDEETGKMIKALKSRAEEQGLVYRG